MTIIKAAADGNRYTLEAKDHTNDSKVCHFISSLVYALAIAVTNSDGAVILNREMYPGYSLIDYVAADDLAEEDFRVILLGLKAIEHSYPDDVKIILKNIFFQDAFEG